MSDTFNYNWIVQGIAQGGFPEDRGINAQDLQKAFGVADVVAFTAMEKQPGDFQTPNGKQIVRVPLDDDIYRPIPPEVVAALHEVSRFLAQKARSGRKVLITCAMGMNRSGLLTGLTIMRAYSMTAPQAIALIRARRPAQGDIYPLANPIFERFLLAHTVVPK